MDLKPVLQLIDINKSFSGVPVLKDISIDIYPGEVHCLLGENGAGKSTLIKIISGSYKSDSGRIVYNDNNYDGYSPRWAHEHGINTIYQEIDLVPHLTVAENIMLCNEPRSNIGNINKKLMGKNAEDIFKKMGVNIDVDQTVGSLRVANQQLVSIAKALAFNSKVIILDEPTAVFTNTEVKLLFELIRKFKGDGIAIIYISHHLDEIFEIGDKITVLKDGVKVTTGSVGEFDKEKLINAMVGRDVVIDRKDRHQSEQEYIFEAKNVAGAGLVKDVSLAIRRGEILGIGGLVGAGRSEFCKLIIGSEKIEKGELKYKGQPYRARSPKNAMKLGIGIVPEDRKQEGIIRGRTVMENMSYSLIQKSSKMSIPPWRKIQKKTLDLFGELNVQPANPYKEIQFLSGGNQQKAVLGKLLNVDCELLILDEPTRGVDVGAREEIYKIIMELRNKGTAVLMITSDLIELLSQSDRILVMAKGKVAAEFKGDEATEESVLAAALDLGGEKYAINS